MWYRLRKWSALSLALSLLAVAAMGCGRNGNCTERSPGGAVNAASSESGEQQPVEATKQIVIDNFTFDPPTLTIPVGTKVNLGQPR